MKRHGLTGFSLIEMMIVVVIIAIITAVAYPSYQDHVRKAKRTEGKTALLKAAQVLERSYSDRGTYTTDLGLLSGTGTGNPVYSGENPADDRLSAYRITAAVGACADLAACYTLTATPLAPDASLTPKRIGFVDPVCEKFTLTSAGERKSIDGTKSATDTCKW